MRHYGARRQLTGPAGCAGTRDWADFSTTTSGPLKLLGPKRNITGGREGNVGRDVCVIVKRLGCFTFVEFQIWDVIGERPAANVPVADALPVLSPGHPMRAKSAESRVDSEAVSDDSAR